MGSSIPVHFTAGQAGEKCNTIIDKKHMDSVS
jgi:hypothetical protein